MTASMPTETQNIYKLKAVSHHLVGGNDAREDGCFLTEAEALQAFATQFAKVCSLAHRNYLYVRRAPELLKEPDFECDRLLYKMVGRFSVVETEAMYMLWREM